MKLPHSYLAILASLGLSSPLWAAPSQIAQESFEGTGGSIGYTTSVAQFIELGTSPQTDFFSVIPNDGSKIEVNRILGGADGTKIFCAEDIDSARTSPAVAVAAEQSLTTNPVNIAGKINTQVRIKLAAPGRSTDPAQYENFTGSPTAIDKIVVEASIDGGAFQRISQFSPSISNVASTLTFDGNGDNLGDSTANPLTAAFQDFTYSIPTGSTVAVRVTLHSNATGEYLACDDIRIFGESAATNPPSITGVPAGNLIFTEGDSATAIAPALTLTDTDSANLTSASVVISQALVSAEDVLAATPSGALLAGNIVYTPATGTLAITGIAPLADYQAVLRSVTYRNSNNVNPSTNARRVTFVTSDGANSSNSPIRDINVVDNISVQSVPFVESFETEGRGTRYSVDGGFSTPPSMFARTQPGALTGLDGTFAFGVENVDDNPDPTELVTFRLNGAGATGITGELRVAAGGGAVYDNNAVTPDFLRVEASADGGAYETVLAFYPDAAAQGNMRQDTTPNDATNLGDGTQLTSALQTFSFNLPTSTNLIVRIRAFSNIAGENILFDRLVVNGPPPPTVASVSSSSTNRSYKVGEGIPVVVTFSSPVNVTGTPQLTLETGATDRVVNYTSGTGTNALTFNYTVQAGDTSADLDYISTSALSLNGGSISSTLTLAAATLTLPSPGAAGSLGANKAIVIDGVVPTVASVNSSTSNGSYKIGDPISIQINFSEAVTVSGTPQLTLETGATDQVINYGGGSGTSSLTFTYTIQAGDSSSDLDYLSTGALALNGGAIADAAGNNATLTLASPGAANSLGANKALVIDGFLPTAGIVVADNSLIAGETSLVTFTFSEAVSGLTTADLTVDNGVVSGLGSSNGGITWTATLTPAASVTDATNLIVLDNTGVIDTAGNPGSGTTSSNNYAIDTQRPVLASSIALSDTALKIGDTSSVTFVFTEAVTGFTTADVTTPNGILSGLTTADGGITWTATLTPSASVTDSTNILTLDLTGLIDIAGNTGTGTATSGNYAIDTVRPSLAAAITLSDTALKIGDTSTVTFTFAEAVSSFTIADVTVPNGILSGLTTGDGGITWTATLTPSASVTDSSNVLTLDLTGLVDLAGNAGAGSTDSGNYAVDTTRPTAGIVVADTDIQIGETSLVTFTFNEQVSGFTNADLTIQNGTLTSVSTGDGGTTWTGTFTPTPNINDATNVITLDNTGVTDAAGNSGSGTTDSNNYAVSSLTVSIAANAASTAEGTGSGATAFTFTVSRTGGTSGAVTMDYAVTGAANATDFGGTLPSGQFTIPDGQASAVLTINVSKDSTVESDEAFTVTLSNASAGYVVSTAAASSTITNDDFEADLAVTVTDGVTTAVPGTSVTYTITASNAGPHPATSATLADTFPASLSNITWTSVGAGGGAGTLSGSGNINDTLNLPVGGSVTYTVSATISAGSTGTLSNTASVSSSVTDPVGGNNSATDTDTLTPQADLSITKTDGVTTATPGGSVTYTITASNSGPSNVTGATLADTFPAALTATWTAVGAGGGTVPASGSGNINASVNLPVGGSVTFTVSATISPAVTGVLTNTATITAPGGVTDPTPGNNSATDSDTLAPQANLSITKTDGVTTATPGNTVTYTITASNAGPSNAPGATVADTLPASLTGTWTAVGAGGGTMTASGSGNINDTVNLPAGASVTYTVTATISAAATGTLTNTATVTAPGGVTDTVPGNNTATDSDTLTPSANLSITKTDGVTTATPGGSVTYTITASNAGPSNAPVASVADTLPGIISGATWTAVGAGGGTVTASGSGNINDTVNLPVGSSVTYTVIAPILSSATGTLTNTATVTSAVTDPTPGNNSATDTDTLTPNADLAITKTDGVTSAVPGNSVTYTITASNAGPSNVIGATVADTLPGIISGATWTAVGAGGGTVTASGSGNINDTVNLPAGASVTYTVTAPILSSATGSLSNTATITSAVTDPTPGNNTATDTDTLTPNADLSITKTDGVTSAVPGNSVTYTITAANAGPSNVIGATIADTLPGIISGATWTAVGAGGGTATAGGSGSINDTVNLPAGGSVTYTVTAPILSTATGTLSNTAAVSSAVTDPTPGNNNATDTDTLTPQADLAVTITDSPDPVNALGNLTYTINLTSTGPSTAVSPTVNLPLPASTTFVSSTAPSGWTTTAPAVGANGTITFTDVSLASGGSATFTVTAKVAIDVVNDSTLSATTNVSSTTTDLATGNNSATTTTLAKSGADLELVLTDAPDPVIAGTELTYTLQLANHGPLDADNVSISDTLPAGTTFVSLGLPAGWSATTPAVGANGTVTITKALFANAGSETFTLVAKVDSNVASGTNLSNTAVVSSNTVDIVPSNNSSTTSTAVSIQSDLAVEITGTPATAPKGSNVTYTITLTNNGPSDAAAPYLYLPIPSQMTFVSVTAPAGWTASAPPVGGGGTVDFSATTLANGATASFTIVAKVKTNATNGTVLTATAVASATGVDPVPASNSDSTTSAVGTTTLTGVQPITTGIGVTSQTGLFDVTVNVTNTTPLPINGFRLHVDFSAYKAAYPSLRLYNASSAAGASDVYIDYPFPVAVDALVAMKLSFYTSTRTFPSPFKPKLTVEILPTSQLTDTNGSGVQPRLVRLADTNILLEFPSKVGRWYRVRFSSDMVHWQDCPVPLQAGSTRMQWIDSGPPFTDVPPAQAASRFYLVNEIAAP